MKPICRFCHKIEAKHDKIDKRCQLLRPLTYWKPMSSDIHILHLVYNAIALMGGVLILVIAALGLGMLGSSILANLCCCK